MTLQLGIDVIALLTTVFNCISVYMNLRVARSFVELGKLAERTAAK